VEFWPEVFIFFIDDDMWFNPPISLMIVRSIEFNEATVCESDSKFCVVNRGDPVSRREVLDSLIRPDNLFRLFEKWRDVVASRSREEPSPSIECVDNELCFSPLASTLDKDSSDVVIE